MSFTQGLSGLNSAAKDLSVIGNNVANANTVGFKGSQAQFSDVFGAALTGSGTTQIGFGAKVQTVAQQFSQGNMSVTNNNLDMAINGKGFFIMNDAQGAPAYSRNGQFQLDKNGFIVSSAQHKLQGYSIDPVTLKQVGIPRSMTIPTTAVPATATGASTGTGVKGVIAGVNLDSRVLPPTAAFNPIDPTTFNDARPTTTFDSLGNAQTTTMYFVKSSALDPVTNVPPAIAAGGIATLAGVTTVTLPNAIAATSLGVGQSVQGGGFPAGTTVASVLPLGPGPYTSFTTSTNPIPAVSVAVQKLTIGVPNSWNVFTTVTNPVTGSSLFPLPPPAAGAWVANGTMKFNTNGTYLAFNPNAAAPTAAANLAAGVSGPNSGSTSTTFTPLGATVETIPFDFTASTQTGTAFGVTQLTQDGFTTGTLSGFSVGADGIITGRYSNNTTRPLGQVALANFANMQGLQPIGNNEWVETGASGGPVINAPGSGNNGVLQTSSTEDSNVDLTAELVNMITAQRVYQANAQTIKTQNAMLQTIVNLR